ncbi:M20 metallopeptidase family protein [Bryobacter aggregatus]|uniref:M20 metallopeptidase family protein n=1 Tax=Bryobacter aggregatus TaxID=360054 RepID=UPI0004E23F80|nr:amidohydrolase [Bryobacter aggregatus]
MKSLLFLLASSLAAQSLDTIVAKEVAAIEQKLVDTRRELHMHPELSNQEIRTGKFIADRLRELKVDEIRTDVAGHGVVAVIRGKKPGPVVAWRTDIDALPIDESKFDVPYKSRNAGVKHACGHDGVITVALGLAEVLVKLRDQLPGTVKIIFQPAEEGVSNVASFGAQLMIEQGALENPKPSAIFAYHASPLLDAGKVGYTVGPFLASVDSVDITIKGQKAHGASPQLGTDAVVTAAQCINMLQTIHSRRINTVEPSVLTIGTIHGGDRGNIIADTVKMEGTLRTFNEQTREAYRSYVKQTLQGCTSIMGATADYSWQTPAYPVTTNPEDLTKATLPSLERVLGKSNVLQVAPQMGAEDFSLFQKQIPGVMMWLGIRNEARGIVSGLHTADFDIDEAALPVGVKTAAAILVDYLSRK